jgi:single-strand DNA-binding protein
MAGSINKVILIGNLGKAPEIRATQDGREIANLTLATSESWNDKNSGEKREKTEWHRIVVFNPGLVTLAKKYLHKGSKIYVEGQLQTRKWTDNTGAEKYTTEVVLQAYNGVITFLDSKPAGGGEGGGNYGGGASNSGGDSSYGGANDSGTASYDAVEGLDDEIPF